MLLETMLDKLANTRYDNATPLQIAQYFEQLSNEDKSIATAGILMGDRSIAHLKIVDNIKEHMRSALQSYLNAGMLPIDIVEELLK